MVCSEIAKCNQGANHRKCFNQALSKFYDDHGTMTLLQQWLDDHAYPDAADDLDPATWDK